MAVNDMDMLPAFLLKNKLFANLLEVEDIEIRAFYDYLLRLKAELNITTADELLSRYEKIFDIKAKGTRDDRIRKILLKLNTRGTASKTYITDLVSLITGKSSEVIENFATYSFDIIAEASIDINDKAIRDINAQIEEIKPAHLAFRLILYLESISVANKNDFSLDLLDVFLGHNAFGEDKHYLDGYFKLDGSKLLDSGELKRLSFSELELGFGVRNINVCRLKVERI